jgi:hypothetical protein
MKRLFLTTLLILLSIFGYSQSNNLSSLIPTIKFKTFQAKKIDNNTIQAFFEVEENIGAGVYVVWLSFDRVKFEPRKWICSDGLKGNKKYYVTIKIKE